MLSINDKKDDILYKEEKEVNESDTVDTDTNEDIDIDSLIEEKLKKKSMPLEKLSTHVSENQIENMSQDELITLQKRITALLNK